MGLVHQKVGRERALRWLWLSLLIVLLDYLTKYWVVEHLYLYQSLRLNAIFNLTYVINYGAAFSSLWGFHHLLVLFSSVVSLVLVILLYKTPRHAVANRVALSLILGGALGNLVDRIRYGYVIDFLDFHLGAWHYPTFNLADSAICIGAFLLIWQSFFPKRIKKADSNREGE